MRKLLVLLFFCPLASLAQNVGISPTISPALFRYNDQITVVYDVTGTSLASLTNAYAWVWIPGTSINAQYNINPATPTADPAKFIKSVVNGKTLFTKVFTPSDFFTTSISAQTKMGILLKAADWAGGQTIDHLVDFWDGSFQVKLTSPTQLPLFVTNNEVINITAETPVDANYSLYINNVLVNQSGAPTKNYAYQHTVTETSGYSTVKVVAALGENSSEETFQYIISTSSPQVARPAGIIPGINYNSGDPTKVTLCLLAPGKTSVYVRGDFSEWDVQGENLMKRDGELFWIELSGLTAGEEYAYQYLVDETVWLADPFADKFQDPDDQYISSSIYPDLKTFPAKALSNDWYFNRLSVFKTNQQAYQWQVTNFQKPPKEKLIVYELLIRDFFEDGENSFQSMIDTISYFKRLGVNAIQLMPIMEFGGNNSWGYNPQFMFAPDKAYGPKDKMKEFVDVCHQNGIAVILDIALNHQDTPNPYILMDFNFGTFKVNPTNKWFNVDAKHPYNVFYDMNHESQYTKDYVDTIAHYWLNEYKVDGYRFDLSKGFTQNANCAGSQSNEGCFASYDASRIAIIKRMADQMWAHTEDAIIILEHFAANTEEKELVEYRLNEGKGMLVWGNLNHAYAQNSMSFSENSDVSWIYHGSRGWSKPHVVGYMESHDEERMMYRNLQFGRTTASHNIKTVPVSLERIKAATTMFYTIPGPKMLWQFGELGYDYPINYCPDGTISNDCRTYPKPVKWDYRDDAARYRLYSHVSDLIRLHNTYDVFYNGTATFIGGSELVKQIVLKNSPYTQTPTSADQMNAVVVANFDIVSQIVYIEFPHTGTWYDYYRYGAIQPVDFFPFPIEIPPGGYKIFTDVEITNSIVTGGLDEDIDKKEISLFPNPTSDFVTVTNQYDIIELKFYTLQGMPAEASRVNSNTWDLRKLQKGVFIAEGKTAKGYFSLKVIKN
jgi:1,4-alpha-glucan branching enzyme